MAIPFFGVDLFFDPGFRDLDSAAEGYECIRDFWLFGVGYYQ